LQTYIPLLLLGLGLWGFAWRDRRALLPAWYMLVAPLTLFAAGETGSHHNHLLETLLACSVAGCACAGLAARSLARRPFPALGVLALFGLQLLLAFQPLAWYGSELAPNPKDPPDRYLAFISNTPGEILADDPGLLLMEGKPIRYDDASTQGPAAAIGKWDQSGLLDDIAHRRFSAIMIPVDVRTERYDHAGRWTPEMIAAIRANYQLLYRDRIITYVPK
jgi:hypothetical protein